MKFLKNPLSLSAPIALCLFAFLATAMTPVYAGGGKHGNGGHHGNNGHHQGRGHNKGRGHRGHGKHMKVAVCHLDDEGVFKLINVPMHAAMKHLDKHGLGGIGDYLPEEGAGCEDVVVEPTYQIGDTGPGGGIVFYIENGGTTGLEAAPEDVAGTFEWGCYGVQVETDLASLDPLTDGYTLGTGAINTATIVSHNTAGDMDVIENCEGYAALAADGYVLGDVTDWFLPSEREMSLLQTNVADTGLLTIGLTEYWTSTNSGTFTIDPNFARAWYQADDDGAAGGDDLSKQDYFNLVRPIRVF